MKIFGKTLKEYLAPVWYYVVVAVLVVISQYYVALPLQAQYPFLLNLTQALWALAVALSVFTVVNHYAFNLKQVLFLGVLYCFIIHGLKAFVFRVFLFPYSGTLLEVTQKIISKFLYGSLLVMAIVVILGPFFIYCKKKKWL